MSRIAGIISKKTTSALRCMLSSQIPSGYPHECQSFIFTKDSTAIGFIGSNDYSAKKNENISIVLDGTIYNLEELGKGTDAEIIIQLYKKYGFPETLSKLNGDFAIALHDFDKDELAICVRVGGCAYASITRGKDRRAGWRSVINAAMRFNLFSDRMQTP